MCKNYNEETILAYAAMMPRRVSALALASVHFLSEYTDTDDTHHSTNPYPEKNSIGVLHIL